MRPRSRPSASALVLALALGCASAAPPTQSEIETALTCQCGCGLTVHSCNHLNCPSGIPLKREIAGEIARGGSREEILAHFQEKYGEKILSSPTLRGFNLAAWTIPFVAIALGGVLVGAVLLRWRRATPAPSPNAATDPLPPDERERIDRALRDWDERA